MRPTLKACYFGGDEWSRLARVLEFTAGRHCPGWQIDVRRISPPAPTHALSASRMANTHKLDWWTDEVHRAEDGTRVVLIDVDTMILGALDEAWAEDFDFGYTVKEGRFPFNAGVVFLRISPRVREFMLRWRAENRRMFEDPGYHEPWRRQFAGMNQSALGKLLTDDVAGRLGVRLGRLPCTTWNCENASWSAFREGSTRVVHIKDGLRPAALGLGASTLRIKPLVQTWRALERQAKAASDPRLTTSPTS